jgi:hypothetical protein
MVFHTTNDTQTLCPIITHQRNCAQHVPQFPQHNHVPPTCTYPVNAMDFITMYSVRTSQECFRSCTKQQSCHEAGEELLSPYHAIRRIYHTRPTLCTRYVHHATTTHSGSLTILDLGERGYRKFLRDQLRVQSWKVNMVGSVQTGTRFADNASL